MGRARIVHRDRFGIWYDDLYFPYVGDTLQSPITGKVIYNKHKLDLVDLIQAHTVALENSDVEIKSLPLWYTYTEVKREEHLKVSYQTFMTDYLPVYANEGYSETLLTTPAPV